MAITEQEREGFNTVHRAFENGDVCAMETIEKETSKRVVLICRVGMDEQGMYCFQPIAELLHDGDFDRFLDPVEAAKLERSE